MKKSDKRFTASAKSRIGKELSFASKEAYNLLRTNILFSFPDHEEGRSKVIGFTSTIPGEGKSTISINLAYSLAEAGYRVMLIDGDMRRPSIGRYIGKPTAPGLSNFLTASGNRVQQNIIYNDVLCQNLNAIMAGDIPPNPSEILGSERMKELLASFSTAYDFVLIDLPPVLSVPDPLVAAKWVDGMVVIVHHDYTNEKEVHETIRQLKFCGVRILGFVYNAHNTGNSSYFGGYNRNKYYYSQTSKGKNRKQHREDEHTENEN